ncbi:MAG: ATP-binding cassette domain-containing protein [Acidothermaceae bacterium]
MSQALSALVADELVKTYAGRRGQPGARALNGLTLSVEPGTVFALLGPNGAGKSTTVRILTALSRPDSGGASVAGIDALRNPDQVRHAIGLVSQKPSSDPMATGRENLILAGLIQGMSRSAARSRAAELLSRFQLHDDADRLAKEYSGGMSRKLDVAIGLVHRPKVLFLDEPTTGLDPQARAQMWAEIGRLSDHEQVTVLLTTHYLEEADHLAQRLAIVDHGRVVVEGTPEDLKQGLRGDSVVVELSAGEPSTSELPTGAVAGRAYTILEGVDGLRDLTIDGARLRARADVGARAVPIVLAALESAGISVSSVTVARPSLDDVYLRHVGHSFSDQNFGVAA